MALPSQIPLSLYGLRVWANPGNWLKYKSGSDGSFQLRSRETPGTDVSLYLVARGGPGQKGSGNNPAIALLTVLGNTPPDKVVINEMTTVASVWTNAQFLDGTAIKGHALGLRVAAGNVPNFVDLQTGGWGVAIADPLNSGQTPTMANFATLADVLAGCATLVTADACDNLFIAATPPKGAAADRHAGGGSVHRSASVVSARKALRPSGPILSGPEWQEPATCSVHAVPELGTQCLGAAT